MNKKILNTVISTSLIGTALVLPGCGGGGGGSSATAKVPANAVVIDSSNAEPTVQSAASSAQNVGQAFSAIGAETPTNASLKGKLHIVDQIIRKSTVSGDSSATTATGASGTYYCPGGGSVSGSYSTSGNTTSGSATFSSCSEGTLTINGSLKFSDTYNNSTGDYSDSASGNLSMVDSSSNLKISFAGLDYAETGNDFNGTYTISKMTFSVDFTTGGTTGGGFLFELQAPIVESSGGFYSCPESGDILITGANGTTAEGIFNGDDTVTIKANGSVVTTTSCTGYY